MDQLRELIESDLADTLEGDFGLPITLIGPDGSEQQVYGQILYDTRIENPETGADIVVHKPVVTVRRSSLNTVPISGEKWAIIIPTTPDRTADTEIFFLERPSEDGNAIGFIRLYLMKAEQSEEEPE